MKDPERKSKEEILLECRREGAAILDDLIFKAMEEYGKHDAIAFGEWLDKNAARMYSPGKIIREDHWQLLDDQTNKEYSTSDLYNQFIASVTVKK